MPELQVIGPGYSPGSYLGSQLGAGLGQGLSAGLNQYFEQKQNEAKTNQLLKALGIDTSQKQTKAGSGLGQASQAQGQSQGDALNLTPENVIAASMINPQMAGALGSLYQTQEKTKQKQREHDVARSGKYLQGVSEMAQGLPQRRLSVNTARQAINSGQMNPLGGDFFADLLHLPGLKSASGAQLATSAKINLISTLSDVSAKGLNQFLEKQINNAFPISGQTTASNNAQLNIVESVLDIEDQKVKLANQLEQQYEQTLGYVPPSIDREVQEALKPYADQRMKELSYDLQENIEKDKGLSSLSKIQQVPKGTPLTKEKADVLLEKIGVKDLDNPTEEEEQKVIKLASRLGYEIPPPEFYMRNQ